MATPKARRAASVFRCTECGWETAKWVGRCGECQSWSTVVEVSAVPQIHAVPAPVSAHAVPIGEVPVSEAAFRPSGVPELDRVLGGGLVPGAAILLAGEPGVGKSTLLLEVAAQTAGTRRVLYVTGEESATQVRLRADRTGAIRDELYLAAETDLGAVLTHIDEVRPDLLVVDSIQTIAASDSDGVPGGVTQIKEVAAALIRMAKTRGLTTIIVGHVTKDGSIAGPRVLEHLVDVVLHFEGDRDSRFRMVRAMKNRFGPVDEVGCFDLTSEGIVAVTDPTGLFIETHHVEVPGTCIAVSLEGRRPMLSEVQALVAPSPLDRPRRTTSGVDSARVAMVLAVLQRHARFPFHEVDVFASTVGGARLTDPASDLSLALALASASLGRPIPRGVVAMGELGLAGEIRRIRDVEPRLAEAARLGFSTAVVPGPEATKAQRDGMTVVTVNNIVAALDFLRLTPAR